MENKHGIDCGCIECQKIRDLLHQKEIDGTIMLSGDEKDIEKIRR